MSSFTKPYIIIALDYIEPKKVWALVDQLDPKTCRVKVGKALFTACGPMIIKQLIAKGFSVFLDLKFHDIPNTVANACKVAADSGVWMINIHALGGLAMMQAAKEAISSYDTLLIGVTVLTSLDEADLKRIGILEPPSALVQRLALLTQEAGLDGVVCSSQEARILRASCGPQFCLVTPGIRLSSDITDDQKRIVTPSQAIKNGSDYLVIGRPITQAQSPLEKLNMINVEINK